MGNVHLKRYCRSRHVKAWPHVIVKWLPIMNGKQKLKNGMRGSLVMRVQGYLVIFERSKRGWGAYVPDLPGLGVAGATRQEVEKLVREGVDFHLEGVRMHGDPIPEPTKD